MRAAEHKWNGGHGCPLRRFASLMAVSVMVLNGCGTTQPARVDKSTEEKRRLTLELNRTQAKLDELRERTLAQQLRTKLRAKSDSHQQAPEITGMSAQRSTSATRDESLVNQKVEPKIKHVGSAETGEHFLYGKVIESYRRRNSVELNKSLQLLLKTYPESVYADNALYLAGMAAFESGDSVTARAHMSRILNEFANGNKAVSALFASALIEKREKNYNEASRLLKRVRANYPGSPEAVRVELELKLFESAPKMRQES